MYFVNNQKQPICLSIVVSCKTLWYIQRIEYYAAVKKNEVGTSLVVQWLRLCASTARGPGSIPGWGTKILRVAVRPKKKGMK